MQQVSDAEARAVLDWLLKKGMTFHWGKDEETELTEAQTLLQCKMYIAAVRLADEFGCATIGIQYQQGLKDLAPASDLVEGSAEQRRPAAGEMSRKPAACCSLAKRCRTSTKWTNAPGLDGLVTYRLWRELGFAPENTLHDLRWGQHYKARRG